MTRTRIQDKLSAMTVDQATEWLLKNYLPSKGEMIVVRFDGAQAAAPVTVNGRSTQYQVADFRHNSGEAVRTLGNEHGVDVVFVVGAYWHQDYQGRPTGPHAFAASRENACACGSAGRTRSLSDGRTDPRRV